MKPLLSLSLRKRPIGMVKTMETYEDEVNKGYAAFSDAKVVWSTECTVDELQLDLCKAKEELTIDLGFYVNSQRQVRTKTVAKYHEQALGLMKWIPIARPPPSLVINSRDLSPKVIEELEARIDDPQTFSYILKQAVGRIFENIDFDYYHQSVARSLMVRLEP